MVSIPRIIPRFLECSDGNTERIYILHTDYPRCLFEVIGDELKLFMIWGDITEVSDAEQRALLEEAGNWYDSRPLSDEEREVFGDDNDD